MTSIEKTTFKAQTVISLAWAIVVGLTSYFSNKQAIKDGMNEIKIEIQAVKSASELKHQELDSKIKFNELEVDNLRTETHDLKDAIISYLGVTPEPIKRRR